LALSDIEKKAASIVPRPTPKIKETGLEVILSHLQILKSAGLVTY
jgi:hypothetical protein